MMPEINGITILVNVSILVVAVGAALTGINFADWVSARLQGLRKASHRNNVAQLVKSGKVPNEILDMID